MMNAIKLCFVLASGLPSALGYSSHAGSCTYPGGSMGSQGGAGTGNFELSITDTDNNPVTDYIPGDMYSVTLAQTDGNNYAGYLVHSVAGSPGTKNTNGAGQFMEPSDAAFQTKDCSLSNNAVSHTSSRVRSKMSSDTWSWTAPDAGTGDVTFHAIAVVSTSTWFGRQTDITLTVNEMPVSLSKSVSRSKSISLTSSRTPSISRSLTTGYSWSRTPAESITSSSSASEGADLEEQSDNSTNTSARVSTWLFILSGLATMFTYTNNA